MKEPSRSARIALFTLSGNTCAFPDCQAPMYEAGSIVGVVCHIHAHSPGGPRFNDQLTEEEVNGIDNLVLLCPTHHKVIDDQPDLYDATSIRRMKTEHESRATPLPGAFLRRLIESLVEGESGRDSSVRGDVVGGNKIVFEGGAAADLPKHEEASRTDDSSSTAVEWEARDTALVHWYLDQCAKYDQMYVDLASDESRVREHFISGGLARLGADGETFLTKAGVLLCCGRRRLPRDIFHVHVKLKTLSDGQEYYEDFFGPVIYLYQELHRRLVPLVGRRIGTPGRRDESGGEAVYGEYPETVLVEALVNFLIHRDYASDDIGFITVHPDRIEFSNPGQSAISPDELMSASSPVRPRYRRNPRLIEALNLARLNQREGSGILRMRQALEANGSLRADGSVGLSIENDQDTDRFTLAIYRRPPPSFEERLRSLEADTRHAVTHVDAEELLRKPAPFLAGHDSEVRAVSAFAKATWSRTGATPSLLVFGWPGTAKTVLPRAVAYSLNRDGLSFGLVEVSCGRLAALDPRSNRSVLTELTQIVAELPPPSFVVLDELDAIAPARGDVPMMARFTSWLIDFIDSGRGAAFVIAISNNPDLIDPAVLDRFIGSLYMALPDEATVARLLRHIAIPNPAQVAKEVLSDLSKNGRVITGRSLVRAAEFLDVRGLSKDLDPVGVAQQILMHSNAGSDHEVRMYEEQHHALVTRSADFVRFWLKEAGTA